MKNKPSKLQQKRWIVQTVIFLFACTVFITYRLYISGVIGFKVTGIGALNPFAGYDTMFQWATQSFYRPNFKSFALILAAVMLLMPLISGRFFCGWICPFGTFQDYFSHLGKKILKAREPINSSLNRSCIRRLEFIKYGVLAAIILSKGIYGKSFLTSWDPWTAFANLPVFFEALGAIPIAFIILFITAAGAVFADRFFCRFLCPLGALQGLVSLIGLGKIGPLKGCKKCGNCHNTCPVGINLSGGESSFSPECINCLKCVEFECQGEHKYQLYFGNRIFYPLTYLMISLFVFGGLIFGLRYTGYLMAERQIIQAQGKGDTAPETQYQDGVYNGLGHGFAPGLEVRVQVKGGKIASVDVVKHQETWGYYEEAFIVLAQQMVDYQSIDIDGISGATYTSNGLKEGVENALEQASP